MFERPHLENYASYQHYALAAIGYAYVLQGNSCRNSDTRVTFDHSFDHSSDCICAKRVSAIENGTGLDDSTGKFSNNDHPDKSIMVIGSCIVGGLSSDGDEFSRCNLQGGQSSAKVSDGLRRIGVNSSNVVDDVNCVSGRSFSADSRSQEVANSGNSASRFVPGAFGSDTLLSMRGDNWDRNQKWKARRKMRKGKRQQMQNDWRTGSSSVAASPVVESVVKENKRGFFSECDDDVRRKLRDSRAAALVAKNDLEAARARQQLGLIDNCSPQMTLAKELIRVTGMANKLKRNTKDQEIGGWAKTVADNLTKSVADSAPSSVPSLESVGYGKSGLRSSDGSFIEADRLKAYNAEMAQLERDFDAVGVYSDVHYEAAVTCIKEKYADIAYTGEEIFRRKYNDELIDKLLSVGLSPATVDDILGIDSEASGVPRYAPGMEIDNDAVACILRNSRFNDGEDAKAKEEKHWEMCRKAAFDNGFDRNNVGKI